MQNNVSNDQFYIAVIVEESASDAPGYVPLYEESFVLIKANSQEGAQEKALEYAHREKTGYTNEQGETITWSLKQLVDVSPLLYGLDDQTELYARHFRNYDTYRSFEPLLSGEEI